MIDGAYHVLFAVSELCESNQVDPLDEATAKAKITQALNIVKDLVKQETKMDEAFTTNRFFKDAKTKSKIQRVITSNNTSRTNASRRRLKRRA